MNAGSTNRGFTILEALVAVAIMGTAVAAGMSVISTSLRNAARIEDYQRVALLSRSQMNELLALPEWKAGQSWRGTWNAESHWIARVERVPEAAGRPWDRDVMRLLLTATWKTTRGEKLLHFETVRLQAKAAIP